MVHITHIDPLDRRSWRQVAIDTDFTSEIVLGDSQQRRRGIDEIGTAAKPASRILWRVRRAQDLEEISGVGLAVAECLDRREYGLRGGLVAERKKRRASSDHSAKQCRFCPGTHVPIPN